MKMVILDFWECPDRFRLVLFQDLVVVHLVVHLVVVLMVMKQIILINFLKKFKY